MAGMTLDVLRFGKLAKGTSVFTAFMFSFVFYLSPTGKVLAGEAEKENQREKQIERLLENTPEKKLTYRLQKLQTLLARDIPASVAQHRQNQSWFARILEKLGVADGPLNDDDIAEVAALMGSVKSAYGGAIVAFEEEGERLANDRNVPSHLKRLIRERHSQALQTVKQKYQALEGNLAKFRGAKKADEQLDALTTMSEGLRQEQFKRSHMAVDPDQLPWRTPDDKVREPKMRKADLQAALGIDPFAAYVQLASTAVTSELWRSGPDTLPTQADLSESIDVQITEDIKTLAESLNNNPVEIYTWVHNNIRFVPSYGSIQGAQYTLETRRGNATDTASLLIALLRAAGIPARYAYGTVEVLAEKVMNWVGGVTAPEAAQSLLGQGGIPNIALISGGQVRKIRMEHAWVEAYVDFEPSRGVKHIEGDRWTPMDASFKQYEFSGGMSLEDNVPIDVQSLADSIEQSAVINEQEGWVQNIPQGDIEAQLQQFQAEIETYINNQNPDATIGDVLGLQQIKILPSLPLSAGLPYDHIVTQQTFSEVPDSMRHRFKYELATQSYGYPNAPFIKLNEPTVKLAGRKLALSFRPATEDDQAIIESYLPEPDAETGEIDPAALPDTLPGYLINLTAELTIDGEVIQSGEAQTMGTELYETLGLYSPSHDWFTSNNHPIAGEYRAVGLDLQGISAKQAEDLKASLESTKAKLESNDQAQLATLTKHEVMGDLIYGTIMSYFALNDVQDEIQAQPANMVTYRLPSYGIFSTSVQPQYWFGVPRNVKFSGLNMDVDAVTFHGTAKDGNKATRVNFTKASGARLSAMEHLVPEQMFSTPEAPANGISAVKALALASSEGQKIWTINQDNLVLALSEINLGAEVEAEIRNVVLAGKIATAHESQLVYSGWVGSGYLLIDPDTGAGAYKIAGGSNGGQLLTEADNTFLKVLGFIALSVISTVAIAATVYFSLVFFAQILMLVSVIAALDLARSVYLVSRRCDSIRAVAIITAMLTFEALIKISKIKSWIEALIYGVQKATSPEGC